MFKYIKLLNLDLLESFDLKDLKKAYHKMVLKYHPDKAKDEAQRIEFNNKMKKLNEAYDILEKHLKNHGGRYINYKGSSRQNNGNNNCYNNANTSRRTYTQRETYSNSGIYEQEVYGNNNYEYDNGFGEPTLEQNIVKALLFSIIVSIVLAPIVIHFRKSRWYYYKSPALEQGSSFEYIDTNKTPAGENKNKFSDTNSATEEKSSAIQDEESKKAEDEYIQNLHVLVHESWENIIMGKSLLEDITQPVNVAAEFTISKNGKIINKPKCTRTSGYEKIDKAYIDAIMMNMPYKPFPEKLKKNFLDIKIGEII